MVADDIHALWLERVYGKLKLPFWAGAIITAFVGGLAVVWLNPSVAGLDFVRQILAWSGLGLITVFVILYAQLAARYISKRTENVLSYARSLGAPDTTGIVRKLYSTKWVLTVYVLLIISPFIIIPNSLQISFLILYNALFNATLFWALLYSMIALYRVGKLPLTLKPFAEDRSLGLRPFGSASLRIVVIYELATIVFAVFALANPNVPIPVWDRYLALSAYILFGLALFLLPLTSFRSKLVQAKAKELEWVGRRYGQLVEQVRAGGNSHLDEKLVGDLMAMDKIQRDVQQIHTWPFDVGVFTRLTAVILSVVAIILARLLTIALHL